VIKALQQERPPIKVVGSATESTEVLKGLGEKPFDVAIISAELEDGPRSGLRVVREARVSYPHTRIIVMADTSERTVVVETFRAGANGVFSRNDPFEMLCKCIHAVCEGQVWAGSEQLRFVIEASGLGKTEAIKDANGTKLLTKREEELVQLVAEGCTNRDISHELSVKEHTVRNYLFRVFNKLGVSNRVELALYVLKQRGLHQGSEGTGHFSSSLQGMGDSFGIARSGSSLDLNMPMQAISSKRSLSHPTLGP